VWMYWHIKPVSSSWQFAFSFCDRLFGLVIKDIEAMDPSILRGEQSSSKKQKVPFYCLLSSHI